MKFSRGKFDSAIDFILLLAKFKVVNFLRLISPLISVKSLSFRRKTLKLIKFSNPSICLILLLFKARKKRLIKDLRFLILMMLLWLKFKI